MDTPVIVLLSLSPLHIGGAERNMLQIASHLHDKFQIVIVGPMSASFAKRAEAAGAVTHPIETVSKANVLAALGLANLFRRLRARLVHTHDTRGGLLGRIAAKVAGLKVIHTVHMAPFFLTTQPLKRRIYSSVEGILNRYFSDRVIFVSRTVGEMYLAQGLVEQAKAVYIPNGVHRAFLQETLSRRLDLRNCWRQRLAIGGQECVVVWVGRISPQKGLEYLVGAASLLRDYPVRYLVIGDGPERAFIEGLVRQDHLTDKFIFLGFRDQKEVYELLAASDLFVLPSRYECFPYTLLEATALGLPCIASDVGGNREIISSGFNGYLVPPGDTRGLASVIERLVRDTGLRERLSQGAAVKAAEYDEDSMIERTAAVYRAVIGCCTHG
ncbi:MAG: glycosyltransferase [Moorellales bacterium]